jgi:hypothetical protein
MISRVIIVNKKNKPESDSRRPSPRVADRPSRVLARVVRLEAILELMKAGVHAA